MELYCSHVWLTTISISSHEGIIKMFLKKRVYSFGLHTLGLKVYVHETLIVLKLPNFYLSLKIDSSKRQMSEPVFVNLY
jgi:hypothetical protein